MGGLAVSLNALRSHNENLQATTTGQQMQMVGQSLNNYIALRYNDLITMTSVSGAGTATDPGPRTCYAPSGMCVITSQTLINNGLLPSSFSGINPFGATYDYYIRVSGTAPNYDVEGLVLTSAPYFTGGSTPRYDLLGEAMLNAGADSGMTRNTGTEIDGLNGAWVDCSASGGACLNSDWTGCNGTAGSPCFNSLGLLAYRAGYGSSAYAAYLRLDGSTPMTGNLNMGGNDIVNVGNIAATGTITANNLVTNPGATALVLDSSANGTTFATGTGSLAIRNNNGVLIQNTAGTAPGNLSAGVISGTGGSFSGNLTTTGTLTATNVDASNLVYSGGNIQANGNLLSNGSVIANGTVTGNAPSPGTAGVIANGNLQANNGSVVTTGNTGWFNSTYNGGWYMSDSTWLRAINNVGVLTTGPIDGGSLTATGNVTAGAYVQINGQVTAGTACATNGLQAISATGKLLSCVSGVWSSAGGYTNYTTVTGPTEGYNVWSYAVCPAGYSLVSGGYDLVTTTATPADGPGVAQPINATTFGVMSTDASLGSQYKAVALCGQ